MAFLFLIFCCLVFLGFPHGLLQGNDFQTYPFKILDNPPQPSLVALAARGGVSIATQAATCGRRREGPKFFFARCARGRFLSLAPCACAVADLAIDLMCRICVEETAGAPLRPLLRT